VHDKATHRYVNLSSLSGPTILLGLTLAVFGDVLFSSHAIVLSVPGEDLYTQFVYWQPFGFGELRRGNFPLWNPHVFSGAPFFGNFQSALLYPFNWLYLVLPLHKAVNGLIALHVFLIGLFTYFWMAGRGLRRAACVAAASLLMFSGPFFLHVYPGHLNNLAAMAWAPLLFLAIDRLFEQHSTRRSLGSCLLGTFAAAMQILAGHPQYVVFTAVAVGLYAGLRLVHARARGSIVAGILAIYAGAAALTAVQLLTGLQTAAESTRAGGVPYDFARLCSFPPENFLTLVLPGFFGDMTHSPYWGRCYLWEMSLFIGVTGAALALYGAACGPPGTRVAVLVVVVLSVLALGAYTPLFPLLYNSVPGFNKFRLSALFIFPVALFLALLAAIGMDRLLTAPRRTVAMAALLCGAACTSAASGFLIQTSATAGPDGAWGHIMNKIARAAAATNEINIALSSYQSAAFIQQAGATAARSLFWCSGLCLLLAVLFSLAGRSARVASVIGLVAVVEVFVVARNTKVTFDLAEVRPTAMRQFLAQHPGDYRIFQFINSNSAIASGACNIWGYDPLLLKRYAEFMAFSQGADPDKATMFVHFSRLHPLYRMLRCRYGFGFGEGDTRIEEIKDPLPRLQLVGDWSLATNRERAFAALSDPSFDPRHTVILETAPEPKPVRSQKPGTVRLVDASTDHLTIEADVPQPAILLITDSYSSGWRAVALPGSVQQQYQILPANYVLRAIPLAAGHHHLRVEYAPLGFQVGKWISLVALVIYAGVSAWYLRTSRFLNTKNTK